MGSSRSSQGLARRRTRRPSSVLNPGPAQSGWVPHRQDLRCLGRDRVIDPGADPAGAAHPGVDPPPENLVVCGPSGTGKTHFCEALGHVAVDAGHKVSWFSLEHLGALVRRHTAAKAIRRIMRADVIVIDDIGLLPVTADTAEALYRVVDAAYEKRSIALSSNLHPAGFDELMPKTIANATVDRLLLHAHIVMTAGDSIRLTQAIAGKGRDATDQLNPGQSVGHERAVLLAATGQFYRPPLGRSHWPLTPREGSALRRGRGSGLCGCHHYDAGLDAVGLIEAGLPFRSERSWLSTLSTPRFQA